VILRERKKIMRFVIISRLVAITTLATVSIVVAENEQRISPTRTDARAGDERSS
jgi:mRNA-degrading endonuclease toxin of MazEF toxin-antitoxin module